MTRPAVLALWTVLGTFPQMGCGDDSSHQADAAIDAKVDAVVDAAVDAASDARTDGWIPGSPCDATVIELPPSGATEVMRVDNQGDWVAYDNRRSNGFDIFLYDLRSCEEHQVTQKPSHQDSPSFWGNQVLYADLLDPAGVDRDLVLFDIDLQSETRVVMSQPVSQPIFNGRFVVYQSLAGLQPQECCHLMLLDLLTGDEVMLAENTSAPEDWSINETHVAWVAYGGPGKDVFYADLETRTVTHVESTYDQFTAFTSLSGDYLVWTDQRSGDYDIFGIRLSTGEEVQLTTLPATNLRATVRDDVLCFNTLYWTPGEWYEIAVQDLRTGAVRRVTHEPAYGYKCGNVDSGWLVYQLETGGSYLMNKVFAVNLHALGIIDDEGRVIPDASALIPDGP